MMYWTNGSSIEKASMDGKNREFLHASLSEQPHSLVMDYNNQRLYWFSVSEILSSGVVRGSNITNLISSGEISWAIAYYQGYVFTTESTIERINVSGDRDNPGISDLLGDDSFSVCELEGIRVVCQDCQLYG